MYTSVVFYRANVKFGSLESFFRGRSTYDLDLCRLLALRMICFFGEEDLEGTFPAGDAFDDGIEGLILREFLFRFIGAFLGY